MSRGMRALFFWQWGPGRDLLLWGPGDSVAGEVSILLSSALPCSGHSGDSSLGGQWRSGDAHCPRDSRAPSKSWGARPERKDAGPWCLWTFTGRLQAQVSSLLELPREKGGVPWSSPLEPIWDSKSQLCVCVRSPATETWGRFICAPNYYLCVYKQPSP